MYDKRHSIERNRPSYIRESNEWSANRLIPDFAYASSFQLFSQMSKMIASLLLEQFLPPLAMREALDNL